MKTCSGLCPGILLALALALSPAARLGAVPFIRGDANGDGKVTLADVHMIYQWEFHSGIAPQCFQAADANGSFLDNFDTASAKQSVDIADPAAILCYLFEEKQLRPPFPEPGLPENCTDPDPPCGCEVYGGVTPVPDPGAELEVLEASAPGGSDGSATIQVRVASTVVIGGCSGSIRLPDGIQAKAAPNAASSTYESYFAAVDGSILRFGYIHDPFGKAGTELIGETTIDIPITLQPGTLAGRYTLVLEEGELIHRETSRTIVPSLVGDGVLTVDTDVIEGPPPPPPPPPATGSFRLGSGTARPGANLTVPFSISADVPILAYAVSMSFDPQVLEATEIEAVLSREADFSIFRFNNRDPEEGDPGAITGATVFALKTYWAIPANVETEVLRLHFTVDPGALTSTTTIGFAEGLLTPGSPAGRNMINGPEVGLETVDDLVFISGRIGINPDAAVFVRGDANGSGEIDISDAVFTLSYLFTGGRAPSCPAAMDSSADGKLDITDAIFTLQFLFAGGKAPSSAAGDSTCALRS
jgi:hypothetical protein